MGVTKSENFSKQHNRIAEFAKVIGHPARVAILEHVANSKQCICGDLVDVLPLAQATVSQHLKELKNAGLIKGNVEGTKVCYCINEDVWEEMKALLEGWVTTIKKSCC